MSCFKVLNMKKLTTILFTFLVLFSKDFKAQNQKSKTENSFKNIVLFWDTSLSMQNKNLAKELIFLDNYIKDKPNLTIHLVKFSNVVNSEKTYKIEKANWNNLKQELIHTTYDGATSYLPLLDTKYANYDAFLLFTDGYQNETILRTDIVKPLFVISSNARTYFQSLELKTLSNKSLFINLYKLPLKDALSQLGIKEKIKVANYLPKKSVKKFVDFNKVTGYVYGTKGPLEGVNIKVSGKNTGAITNAKGFYSIAAKKSDKLTFSYLGFKTYSTMVTDPSLDIHLLTGETRLSTVEIKGKQKEIVKEDNMGLASEKNRSRGYAVQTLTSKNFDQIETNVAQNVRGKISGLSLAQNKDLSMSIIRGYNTILGNIYPLIILDGVPLRRSDSSYGQGSGSASKVSLSFIDPNNIAKIDVLKGLAATNQYGSQGRNGVIIITTKTAIYNKGENGKPIDRALLQNNIYKEDIKNNTVESPYLSLLQTSKTIAESYNKYLTLRNKYINNIDFYFDVSDYFKQWGNNELSDRVLSNVLELNFNNPEGLLALSFKYDANNNLKKKIYVDKRLLRLRPKNAQSFLDMADNFVKQKKLTKAFYLYKSMLDNSIKNVDFAGVRKTVITSFKNIVQNNQKTLPTKDIDAVYFKKDNINARLYFEWTNPDMDFEIQFVNPQKRFFSWTHSKDYDAQRIRDEKTQGFTSEEFLLIDAAKGDWLINLTNLGESSVKNQILKMVIYKNYGTPQQTRKVKVIDLAQYFKKTSLAKIKI